jgi:hypothetical protein
MDRFIHQNQLKQLKKLTQLNRILIIAVILIGISCNTNTKIRQMEKMLTGDNFKFWKTYLQYPKKPNNEFCFYINGKFDSFNTDLKTGKRYLYNAHDDIEFVASEWKFINDTTMMFGKDIPYKILYFTEDSFALKTLIFKKERSIKFYKQKDQTTLISK